MYGCQSERMRAKWELYRTIPPFLIAVMAAGQKFKTLNPNPPPDGVMQERASNL